MTYCDILLIMRHFSPLSTWLYTEFSTSCNCKLQCKQNKFRICSDVLLNFMLVKSWAEKIHYVHTKRGNTEIYGDPWKIIINDFFKDPIYFRITPLSVYIINNATGSWGQSAYIEMYGFRLIIFRRLKLRELRGPFHQKS